MNDDTLTREQVAIYSNNSAVCLGIFDKQRAKIEKAWKRVDVVEKQNLDIYVEKETLRADNTKLREKVSNRDEALQGEIDRCDKAEKDNTKLREALEDVLTVAMFSGIKDPIIAIARAVLARTAKTPCEIETSDPTHEDDEAR